MPRMQHQVTLSADDRARLTAILRRGTATAYTQRRARVLLKTDRNGPRLTDAQVAGACEVSPRLVARARADWCGRGMACLDRDQRHRPGPRPTLDAAAETRLIALACTTPPDGFAAWSLRLLAARVVELEVAEAISHETVRQTLKKTSSSRGAPSAS